MPAAIPAASFSEGVARVTRGARAALIGYINRAGTFVWPKPVANPGRALSFRRLNVRQLEDRIVVRFDELRPLPVFADCAIGWMIMTPFEILEIDSPPRPVVFESRVVTSCP